MRYEYRRGIQKPKRWWVALPVIGVLVGCYVFFNSLAPGMPVFASAPDETVKKLKTTKPSLNENRLYIPKINVDLVAVGNEGDGMQNAVQRSPESGNPKDGGNYVLAAHRFKLGLTPRQTYEGSPFYHIDKLEAGDELYVDYEGIRYAYKITERRPIPPTATEVEGKTEKDQLTLYPYEGPSSGDREVIIAEPTGTIVWQGGSPKLKTL